MAAVTHRETYSLCRYKLAAVRRLALLAVLGALVAGCGGEDTVQPLTETVEGTVPQAQPPTSAKGNPNAGKQVFSQSGCGGCHTFKRRARPARQARISTSSRSTPKLPANRSTSSSTSRSKARIHMSRRASRPGSCPPGAETRRN